MENKSPLGIKLIGYFYAFGIAIVFITLFSSSANVSGHSFSAVLGWQQLPPILAKLIIIFITAPVIYGFLSQKKWGFVAMILHSIYFLIVSAVMAAQLGGQPFAGNAIWSVIVLVYTLWHKRYFFNKKNLVVQ